MIPHCFDAPIVPAFPPMVTLSTIFKSILVDGYEGHREPLEIAFDDNAQDEAMGVVQDFSICYIDGMQRALCVLGIVHYIAVLDPTGLPKCMRADVWTSARRQRFVSPFDCVVCGRTMCRRSTWALRTSRPCSPPAS